MRTLFALSLLLLTSFSLAEPPFGSQTGDKTKPAPASSPTPGGTTDTTPFTLNLPDGACEEGLAEEDKWIERENCKKVLGGGSGGDSSSGSSSGGDSGGSGGGDSGGGGGGGGKCIQLTMVIKGGGLVCCGGYDGHSDVVEKQFKKYAKNGLDSIKKLCEIIKTVQQDGKIDNAPESILKLWDAMNLAHQASGVYGFWGSGVIELPLLMPLFTRYPKPLAPDATTFDVGKSCDDDDGCKAQCMALGQKLTKNSQECVDNLHKMEDWFNKKQKEALALVDVLKAAIEHMKAKQGGGVGGGSGGAGGSPSPSPYALALPESNSNLPPGARGGISAPNASTGNGGSSTEGSGSFGGSSSGSSGSSANGMAGNSIGGESETVALDPDGTTFSEREALAAIAEASGGALGGMIDGSGDGSALGSTMGGKHNAAMLNAMNNSTVPIPGFAAPVPAFAVTPLNQSGSLPLGRNVYVVNSLSMAKDQAFINPKTGRPDFRLRMLTSFERATRRYFGENGDRRLQLEKTERQNKKTRGKK